MQTRFRLRFLWLTAVACGQFSQMQAQCGSYPVSLEERAQKSASIVLGKETGRHCYEDAAGNIYTLHRIAVAAWLKANLAAYPPTRPPAYLPTEIGVISLGGTLENRAQISQPTLQLSPENEYLLFLEGDNHLLDDKNLRSQQPGFLQSFAYADAQGALTYQRGLYHDLLAEPPRNEAETFARIASLTGQAALSPEGNVFEPREFVEVVQPEFFPVSNFSPNPTNAGTIVTEDFLTINGVLMGGFPGSVNFQNADDGGATDIAPPNASDYVSWSSSQIVVKVPERAGTGTFYVNNPITGGSGSPLNIGYAHTAINSDYSGFSEVTRQRFYLRNMNGSGGYTFLYNTTSGFSSNADATAAFERAVETWRCASLVNWSPGGTTANGNALDGENVVMFDPSLPSGNLAVTTTRYWGDTNGSCNQANTVWCLAEVDMRFRTTPATGYSWEFGPALPSSTEFDFETISLHELGHADGLAHRIATGELMNWSIPPGVAIHAPSSADLTGALVKMDYSTAATCFDPAGCGSGPMIEVSPGACALLPIELLHFRAQRQGSSVALDWATASETNFAFFEIERSRDGVLFEKIGTQAGQASPYFFLDEAPLLTPLEGGRGVNYYRLKAVDLDGSFSYSPIAAVLLEENKPAWQVFPNPVKKQAWLEAGEPVSLLLFDVFGNEIRQIEAGAGRQFFEAGNLPPGVYFLVEKRTGEKIRLVIF